MSGPRMVRVQRGQVVLIDLGGPVLQVIRFESGAAEVRNIITGKLLREWAPAEAREDRRSHARQAKGLA